jgi:hypothetical protein
MDQSNRILVDNTSANLPCCPQNTLEQQSFVAQQPSLELSALEEGRRVLAQSNNLQAGDDCPEATNCTQAIFRIICELQKVLPDRFNNLQSIATTTVVNYQNELSNLVVGASTRAIVGLTILIFLISLALIWSFVISNVLSPIGGVVITVLLVVLCFFVVSLIVRDLNSFGNQSVNNILDDLAARVGEIETYAIQTGVVALGVVSRNIGPCLAG